MIKKLLLTLVPFVIFLSFLIYHAFNYFNLPEVKVAIGGFDPRDFFRGHYIDYSIDWNKTDCSQFENNTCPRFDFNKLKWSERRFYIPEKNASELDKMVRDNKNECHIIFGYKKGRKPVAKRLLINGKEWDKVVLKD